MTPSPHSQSPLANSYAIALTITALLTLTPSHSQPPLANSDPFDTEDRGVCDHHSGKLLSGVLNMKDRPLPNVRRAAQKMRHLLRYYVVSQLLREADFVKNVKTNVFIFYEIILLLYTKPHPPKNSSITGGKVLRISAILG